MTNAQNISDRLFAWYQMIRDAQNDLPAEKLVDDIYDRVVSDVHPDEIREYHFELFCQLCNDRDSITHP